MARFQINADCIKCGKVMSIRSDYFARHSKVCMSCQKAGNRNARTHGDTKTRLYRIYCGMFTRRYSYPTPVCRAWNDWERFKSWALSHGYADNLTIDRKNVRLGYSPSNCQWITRQENAGKDKRIFTSRQKDEIAAKWQFRKITIMDLARRYGVSRNTIRRAINNNRYEVKRNSAGT